MKGVISDIIPFSVNDGPGIRTSVFFKGCPLRCRWCHNPETQKPVPQVMVLQNRCIQCGGCAVCPFGARGTRGEYDASRCRGCGKCVSVCPMEACRLSGKYMTPEEVLRRILPDKPFFRQRGGVTLTGGEPLYQPDFARALASLLDRQGIGVALETSGFAPWEHLQGMLPFVCLFLFDWKISNPEEHKKWTGRDNLLIRENLIKLDNSGANIILRCPVIPGVNDTPEHFHGIAQLTRELPRIQRVDVLPYHALGNDKRAQLGLPGDGFSVPDERDVQRWRRELEQICTVQVCL
ncbi:MAG: glycyl-radical enzyme activating protein [Clostridia bacterium]|nr:glycyl-radical enzyme activating protein [Clostridia bacterium]